MLQTDELLQIFVESVIHSFFFDSFDELKVEKNNIYLKHFNIFKSYILI